MSSSEHLQGSYLGQNNRILKNKIKKQSIFKGIQ